MKTSGNRIFPVIEYLYMINEQNQERVISLPVRCINNAILYSR